MGWRIARKLAGGTYAVYGVDEGLRLADDDKRLKAFREAHPDYHDLMLDEAWAPRDFCGYEAKKLHSNTELVDVLLVKHLGMKEKVVKTEKKTAEKFIDNLRKSAKKEEKKLKKKLGVAELA